MPLPNDLLNLKPHERRHALLHRDTMKAFQAMGIDAAIDWLERHIEDPIGPEWGQAFHNLGPHWAHYERWIRRSKSHCLAAIDGLLAFTPSPYFDDDKKVRMPLGASVEAIHREVDYALREYGNPRLKDAAKRIRAAFPLKTRRANRICVPAAFKRLALCLFSNDAELLKNWEHALAKSLHPTKENIDLWASLLEYADQQEVVAIVDWSEWASEVVQKLRSLRSAQSLALRWEQFTLSELDCDSLLRLIGSQIDDRGPSLASLDTGGDNFALIFVTDDQMERIQRALDELDGVSSKIEHFD